MKNPKLDKTTETRSTLSPYQAEGTKARAAPVTRPALLQLQQQYGNRAVQSVVVQAWHHTDGHPAQVISMPDPVRGQLQRTRSDLTKVDYPYLTEKDVNEIEAKARDQSTIKTHGIGRSGHGKRASSVPSKAKQEQMQEKSIIEVAALMLSQANKRKREELASEKKR